MAGARGGERLAFGVGLHLGRDLRRDLPPCPTMTCGRGRAVGASAPRALTAVCLPPAPRTVAPHMAAPPWLQNRTCGSFGRSHFGQNGL